MAKASDNQFPYIHLVPAAAPAAPSAGERLYLDSGDGNKLKRKNTAGAVNTIEGGGAGGGSAGFTQLRKSADQSLANSTWVALTWDTEDHDTLAGHDNATNPSRFTAPSTGIYVFSGSVTISISSATGTVRYLSLYKNGVQQPGWGETLGTFSGDQVVALSRELALTAGDYVELFAFQNGTGTGTARASTLGGSVWSIRKAGTL